MSDPREILKYVLFDLPFVVFVRDGFRDAGLEQWAEAVAAGDDPPYSRYAPCPNKPSSMIIGGGLPVYMPPKDLAQYYEVPVADTRCAIAFLRRVNPHRQTIMMGEVPGDRTGKASYSTARVTFDLRQIRNDIHDRMDLFSFLAVEAVNHFLRHYRVIADRPWITPVTAEVIQEFHIGTESDDGSVRWQEFGTSSGAMHGFGGAIPESTDQELRAAVSQTSPPDVLSELNVQIRDFLGLTEWRLAVIESAVLFEAYVERTLRKELKDQGIDDQAVEERFLRSDGYPKSITAIVKSMIEEVLGFDFAASDEYHGWETHVRDPRNELIHGSRFDVTEQEALDAFRALTEAIQLIEDHVEEGSQASDG